MLLPLITHMTSKLGLFDSRRLTHMHSRFYFAREMEHCRNTLIALFDDRLLKRHEDKEKPEILDEFRTACQTFGQAIKLAREEAIFSLPSCVDFKVTPTVVYLTQYRPLFYTLPVDELSTIAGVPDVISSLRQYRYMVPLFYSNSDKTWSCMPFNALLLDGEEPGWRTQGTWRDLRISFALQSLKLILTGDAS